MAVWLVKKEQEKKQQHRIHTYMKAVTKNIRMSPKKLGIIARLVRGMPVDEALTRLRFTPMKAAGIVYKTLASATANAENTTKAKRSNLVIASIVVQKGPVLKRGVAVSRGRWHKIQKRMSHLTVTLANNVSATTDKSSAKQQKPAEAESDTKKKPIAQKKTTARVKKPVSEKPVAKKK